ncbi:MULTISPECIES: hypothetical protein [Bacillus]|uniref:hypothetical protein n=1 Tax=Bacillus TaxID=1386 RepID=UPI0002F66C25|nr:MULTISPECIES: hypothetical protein [Bacillus]QAR51942.1 hypothetical protein BAE_03695 [Bacillus aerophilus]BAT50235.1 uncharacterized protein BTUAT1_31010 [Bacillus pumilus]APP15725.1 hypothetical protein BS467_08290 [Bacillus altitudinis]KAJ0074366.1 hypothetical protein DBB48_002940 [Bacillus altitudinis]MBG9901942.1 hypothetical protein [Bacillus altitudinis]
MKTNKKTIISVFLLVFTLMMGTACGKNESENGSSNKAAAKQEKIEKMTDSEYASWYKGYLKRFEERIMSFVLSLVPLDEVYDKEWASDVETKIDSMRELLSEAKDKEVKVPDTYKKVNEYLVKADDKFESLFKDILKVIKRDKVSDDDLSFMNSRMKKALEEVDNAKKEMSKMKDNKSNEKQKDKSNS